MTPSDSRLPVVLEAAAKFVKAAAAVAAERVLQNLALLSQAVTHLAERDLLLAAQIEMRQKLGSFHLGFGHALDERVWTEIAPRGDVRRKLATADWQTLSLVDDAEVEERMFSDRIAQQVSHACEWELRELAGYMGTVTGVGRADDERNPLRAAVVGHALYRAIAGLSSDGNTRRILAREFGLAMAQAMPGCYAAIVEELRARRIEPVGLTLKGVEGPGSGVNSGYATLRDDAVSAYGTGSGDSHGSVAPDTGHRRGSFPGVPSGHESRRQNLPSGRGAMPTTASEFGGGPGGSRSAFSNAQNEADEQLMALLRRLTNLAHHAMDTGAGSHGAAPAATGYGPSRLGGIGARALSDADASADEGLSGLMAVNLIRAHREELVQASTGKLDHMVIDVVGSLFDQILSDSRVPPQMARQIARLQLPVLRVALVDQSFFSSRRHPVRRFVNRMASLAVAFDDFSEGPGLQFLNRVSELVQEIVDGDFDQVELYAAKLEAMESFISAQTGAQVQQSGAAAVLATKESELQTQQRYMLQLQAAMVPISMPAYLREFVCQVWSQTLVLAVSRAGIDSELSRRMRAAGRDVVLSVQPKGAPMLRKRFLMQLPNLMKDLNQGLRLIGWPEAAQKQFFSQLLPSHAESLKGAPMSELDFNLLGKQIEAIFNMAIPGRDQPMPVGPAPDMPSIDVEQRFSALEAQQVGLVHEHAVDWSGEVDINLDMQAELDADDADTTPMPLDIGTEPGTHSGIDIDLSPADPAEPSHGAQLFDHIRLGFAYNMHLKDEWQKVRLSYVSPARSFFVFSRGRRHQESISLTSRMLARMCDSGRLRAVESAYLMERATARARKQLAAMKASGPH